ncbi:MAG: class I SAM-dependent rRNA methyltransferase [Myxococcales bacterium]|nr:class I SAM-dependent rRNA methyltransferase [Myxococcales bacterium]
MVRLRRPLERSVREGHPWIYRDALEPFEAAPGQVLSLLDRKGRFLARGFAELGPIALRVLTTRDEPLDAGLLGRRLATAQELRERVLPERTSAYRLVHGEGDRLPGIVVDRYDEVAVLSLDGPGATAFSERILDPLRALLSSLGVQTLLRRAGRREERRVERIFGPEPASPLAIEERGMILFADLRRGQKTGLFLDHRESRRRVRGLSRGLRVLDLYCNAGGFSIAAALGGAAHVTSVDISAGALEMARLSFEANGLGVIPHQAIAADVVEYLGGAAGREPPWDLIIADPPSFAPSEKAVPKALESYTRLHAAALARLAPGGLYLAASCSSHVDHGAFLETIRQGARKAGRSLQLLERSSAPADHPRLLAFPEGDYLSIFLTRA